jgi:hypothetical protein
VESVSGQMSFDLPLSYNDVGCDVRRKADNGHETYLADIVIQVSPMAFEVC